MIDISKKSLLVDTNIIVYYFDRNSPFHLLSYEFFKWGLENEVSLVVAQQNCIEFVRTLSVDYKVSTPNAISEINSFIKKGVFKVITPLPTTFDLYCSLIKQGNRGFFDLYFAATAIDNGIDTIVTNDPKGFKGIKKLEVYSLEQIVKQIQSKHE